MSEAQKNNLEYLTKGWFSIVPPYSVTIQYISEFVTKPHPLTWKEFKQIFAIWEKTSSLKKLEVWLCEHIKKRDISPIDTANDFIKTLFEHRYNQLSAAADMTRTAEKEVYLEKSRKCLSLMEAIFFNGIGRLFDATG